LKREDDEAAINVDAERYELSSHACGGRFVADVDGHVRTALGVYLLAAIDDEGASAVEAHVMLCASCRDECDRLGDLPALLDLLADKDVRDVLDNSA
jgi:hypothetical protein